MVEYKCVGGEVGTARVQANTFYTLTAVTEGFGCFNFFFVHLYTRIIASHALCSSLYLTSPYGIVVYGRLVNTSASEQGS